jgi:hypothetical protein
MNKNSRLDTIINSLLKHCIKHTWKQAKKIHHHETSIVIRDQVVSQKRSQHAIFCLECSSTMNCFRDQCPHDKYVVLSKRRRCIVLFTFCEVVVVAHFVLQSNPLICKKRPDYDAFPSFCTDETKYGGKMYVLPR